MSICFDLIWMIAKYFFYLNKRWAREYLGERKVQYDTDTEMPITDNKHKQMNGLFTHPQSE